MSQVVKLYYYSNGKQPFQVSGIYPYHYMHATVKKKLKVDLAQENVTSVALWIHLDPGSDPPPFAMI